MKVWVVHWTDADCSTGDISLKKASKYSGTKTITVGLPVTANDDGLVIAMDMWPKYPDRFKVSTFIPWGMVDEWYEVEV